MNRIFSHSLSYSLIDIDGIEPCFSIETEGVDIYFDEETELSLDESFKLKYAEDVVRTLLKVTPFSS